MLPVQYPQACLFSPPPPLAGSLPEAGGVPGAPEGAGLPEGGHLRLRSTPGNAEGARTHTNIAMTYLSIFHHPTNISITRATPLVVISDGVEYY